MSKGQVPFHAKLDSCITYNNKSKVTLFFLMYMCSKIADHIRANYLIGTAYSSLARLLIFFFYDSISRWVDLLLLAGS
jgi:hypothetical protein